MFGVGGRRQGHRKGFGEAAFEERTYSLCDVV